MTAARVDAPTAVLVGSAIACAALTVTGKMLGAGWMVWTFKPLATATIVALAWLRSDARYGRAIRVGLVLSLAGDVLLIPRGYFVQGLVAFLFAHLAYLRALTTTVRFAARPLAFAVVALVAAAILALLWPKLPAGLQVPVLCYVAVLGAMCAQAIARASVLRTAGARVAAIGAALFLMSDAMLAFDRFHTPLPGAALLVLGTYYCAQLLLALSIEARQSSRAIR